MRAMADDEAGVRRIVAILESAVGSLPRGIDPASVQRAVATIHQLDLDPTPAHGQCYLIPYRQQGQTVCQLIIGYRGLLTLAARAGVTVQAAVVYDGERFELEHRAEGTHLLHRPDVWDLTRSYETAVGAYAVFRVRGQTVHVETVRKSECEQYRQRAKPGSPWATMPTQMLAKTPIRRGFGRLPLETDALRAAVLAVREDGEREGETLHDVPQTGGRDDVGE